VETYKARLVIDGSRQVWGENYYESSSPVIELGHFRTLLAFAKQNGYSVWQADVTTAYLYAPLDEPVYVRPPPTWENKTSIDNPVWLLKKSVYGLKQSGRNWHKFLVSHLKRLGFVASTVDSCIHIHKDIATHTLVDMIIGFHVDDLLILAKSQDIVDELVMRLSKIFALKIKGVGHILGLEVTQSSAHLSISIEPYISKIIETYGLTQSNPVSTPGAPNSYLLPSVEPISQQDGELRRTYMELVGSLMYASTAARPDIAQQVSELGRHMSNPNQEHLNAAKRVVKYLKGTRALALTYYTCDSSVLRRCGFCIRYNR
jgi:hypothetical protein